MLVVSTSVATAATDTAAVPVSPSQSIILIVFRILEYIGYNFYELDKPSALTVMQRVGRGALVEA